MPHSAPEPKFLLAPATPNCGLILQRREHVLIGISLFNSQFTDSYIEKLVLWASRQFLRFDILLPGEEETAWLLEAAGTAPAGAAREARRALGRKIKSVHSAFHLASVAPGAGRLFRFSDFREHPRYRALRDQAEQLYREGGEFQEVCRQLARQGLAGRLKATGLEGAGITDAQLQIAVPFVFAEVPFLVDTPALLGVPESVVAYHRPWPLATCLCSGRFPLAAGPGQGFVVLALAAEAPRVPVLVD